MKIKNIKKIILLSIILFGIIILSIKIITNIYEPYDSQNNINDYKDINSSNNNNNNLNPGGISLFEYQDMMLKNKDHKKIYRQHLKLDELKYEDCERQCDATDCIKMREKKKVLDECVKCRIEGKCFKKSR